MGFFSTFPFFVHFHPCIYMCISLRYCIATSMLFGLQLLAVETAHGITTWDHCLLGDGFSLLCVCPAMVR